MKFSEFTIACDNNERLKVYKDGDLIIEGYCDHLMRKSELNNLTVNKFFSYNDNDGHGEYIEVQLIK